MSTTNNYCKIFKNDMFIDAKVAGLALVGDLQLGINPTNVLVWMNHRLVALWSLCWTLLLKQMGTT